ncbi:MAG: hypothetical protein ACRDU8_03525, partial [Egibacteraceae bacterium]
MAGEVVSVEVVSDHEAALWDRLQELEADNAALRAEVAGVRAERDVFAGQVRVDVRRIAELEGQVARLERQVAGLQEGLEAARRAGTPTSPVTRSGRRRPRSAQRHRAGRVVAPRLRAVARQVLPGAGRPGRAHP